MCPHVPVLVKVGELWRAQGPPAHAPLGVSRAKSLSTVGILNLNIKYNQQNHDKSRKLDF
jgi:hypothetical protein